MSVNEELQRLNMVEALPRLLSGGDSASIDSMVPKLHQALPGDGAEFHLIASNTFRTILEQKLVPPSSFTQTFLTSIVACIDSHDPYISKAWLETLLDIIELLPADVVKNDILPVAVARGQLSQSVRSRVTSCELLGKIAIKFNCTQLQKEIVPLVHSLCQDVSGEVRASMCHQLPHIAHGLPSEAVKPALLPLLVELAIDEEQYVRLAAVHTISHVVTILPGDVLKHTIIPLLKKLCDQAIAEEDKVLCAISDNYGQLCLGLKNYFSENELSWFIGFFREMARLGAGKQPSFHDIKNVSDLVREKEHSELLLQCRLCCAFNFPGIVVLTGPAVFEDALYSTYSSLACDHSWLVRRSIAAGIHEIFRVLGARCLVLKSVLISLLSDESRDVLEALVPNLSSLLEELTKNSMIGPSIKDALTFELLNSLLKCEATLSQSNDWRLHSAMLGQLESFAKALPSDLVFSNMPVILFHRIQDSRALPCRLAAARTLLIVLRHTSELENQNEIRNRIFTELCIHHSCHTRLLFVKMCGMALDIFSSFYIKEHFFLRLLSLASDPVPNVRLVLCGLLPRLKSLLKLPHDSNLLSALQEAIERLQNSLRPDKDVSDKLEAACTEMEVMNFSGMGQELNDSEDLARYQEEQLIENRSAVSEPRRLVTVNMKTLGEGKRATLVSLRGPDVSRTELRQSSRLSVSNDSSMMSSVAVSSIGLLGGHAGNGSKITASITSTTSESAPSFKALLPMKNESDTSLNGSILNKNMTTSSFRAIAPIKKEPTSSFNTFTPIKKDASISEGKSWPQLLTNGSRLPVPVSPETNKSHPEPAFKPVLPFSNLSDFDIATVYMLITQINIDSKIPFISSSDGNSPPPPQPSSSSSSSSLLSSTYPALLEEEFYIDAGIPLPEELTVTKIGSSSLSSSDPVSKIPNLRELLFQNSTLLAQVANRTSSAESAAKSLSYVKSFNSSKVVEQSSADTALNSTVRKRFSRLFEENSSSDFRYSSPIGRPSPASSRKDSAGSSQLPKPSPNRGFHTDSGHSSGHSKEGQQYNTKAVSSASPKTNFSRKDSKIASVNRRSTIYYSSHGNDSEGSNDRDQKVVGPVKNGKPEISIPSSHQYSSHETLDLTPSKLSNGAINKFSSLSSSGSAGQSSQTRTSRTSFGPHKFSSTKTATQDLPNRRHSSLDTPDLASKYKDNAKSNIGQVSNKRYSTGDKSLATNGTVDKKVSLSSIGVKGARRSYNPGPRPHSCYISSQQYDKTRSANSRSMSQECLGMELSKAGPRILKRSTTGFGGTENHQSRIPRGGYSCHSSPSNSRPSSPIYGSSAYVTVSHTAPCSARVSRSSSPTDGLPSRVSLASIKLHEPSRLPIRKYNHHL